MKSANAVRSDDVRSDDVRYDVLHHQFCRRQIGLSQTVVFYPCSHQQYNSKMETSNTITSSYSTDQLGALISLYNRGESSTTLASICALPAENVEEEQQHILPPALSQVVPTAIIPNASPDEQFAPVPMCRRTKGKTSM